MQLNIINMDIFYNADSLSIFAVVIVPNDKNTKFMKRLHLFLVYSVSDGSEPSFIKLVNALANILGMELLHLNYYDGKNDPNFKLSYEE